MWPKFAFFGLVIIRLMVSANPDAKRLYDDLLSSYNKLVRPVVNTSDVLRVSIKLKLSQLIDVNLKNQIMTTNLWVEQAWNDYKLQWDPKEYGGVQMLHVPSDHIWRPDIVLYNNADGNFDVTLATKATIYHVGLVEWKPPAIFKSSCEIDVEFFPFDEQTCVLKFGSWTYDGFKVDLRHMDEKVGSNIVDVGVDLSEFYMSVEWDILEVPAVRNEKIYPCCDEPYLDITFNITMRRKTLFYTVNIIIPCMGISFLTVLTFYLPSDSGEKEIILMDVVNVNECSINQPSTSEESFVKSLNSQESNMMESTVNKSVKLGNTPTKTIGLSLDSEEFSIDNGLCHIVETPVQLEYSSSRFSQVTLSISILISLHVFFLLVVEIIPPTSLVVPLLGKYLIFAMILVSISICVTVVVLNVHFRSPQTHKMAPWVKRVFIHILPRLLVMRRPQYQFEPNKFNAGSIMLKGRDIHPCFFQAGCGYDSTEASKDKGRRQTDDSSVSKGTRETSKEDLSSDGEGGNCQVHGISQSLISDEISVTEMTTDCSKSSILLRSPGFLHSSCPPAMHKSCFCIRFIAEHTKITDDATKVKEDWKYVAMVLDRLFLWIFTLAVFAGTAGIILQAPTLYDDRIPIDKKFSEYQTYTSYSLTQREGT